MTRPTDPSPSLPSAQNHAAAGPAASSSSRTPLSARLDHIFAVVSELTADLPFARLLPGEQAILGGRLFFDAPDFIDRVAFGMGLRPDLFPDAQTSAPELEERQRSNEGWRYLSVQFQGLAKLFQDTYIKEQSETIKLATDVTQAVIVGVENPRLAPHLDHEARSQTMGPALVLLHEVKQQVVGKKARRRAERLAAARSAAAAALATAEPSPPAAPPAAPAPATPPPAPPHRSPPPAPAAPAAAPPRSPASSAAPPQVPPRPARPSQSRARARAQVRSAFHEIMTRAWTPPPPPPQQDAPVDRFHTQSLNNGSTNDISPAHDDMTGAHSGPASMNEPMSRTARASGEVTLAAPRGSG